MTDTDPKKPLMLSRGQMIQYLEETRANPPAQAVLIEAWNRIKSAFDKPIDRAADTITISGKPIVCGYIDNHWRPKFAIAKSSAANFVSLAESIAKENHTGSDGRSQKNHAMRAAERRSAGVDVRGL